MEWISVNDNLPNHELNVLAILDGQLAVMAYFDFMEEGVTQKVWGYCYDNINDDAVFDDNYYPTHWMELPKPPEK